MACGRPPDGHMCVRMYEDTHAVHLMKRWSRFFSPAFPLCLSPSLSTSLYYTYVWNCISCSTLSTHVVDDTRSQVDGCDMAGTLQIPHSALLLPGPNIVSRLRSTGVSGLTVPAGCAHIVMQLKRAVPETNVCMCVCMCISLSLYIYIYTYTL